jgi:hypothetical protein
MQFGNGHFNNFSFQRNILEDLGNLDACIPLKNEITAEIIIVVLVVVWLEKNEIYFTSHSGTNIQSLGLRIIGSVEIIIVVLVVVWLEKNEIYFTSHSGTNIQSLGLRIIGLATFWF